MAFIMVCPEEDFEHVQFDLRTDQDALKEGILFFNRVWGLFTVCKISMIKTANKTVVIMSELVDNPGQPIRRVSERLATFIHSKLLRHLSPSSIVWVEHYRHGINIFSLKRKDSFFQVTYTYRRNGRFHEYKKPYRNNMETEVLHLLLGESAIFLQKTMGQSLLSHL